MIVPKTLQDKLREGKVVPFIGAGVSMSVSNKEGKALFPSWKQVLLKASDRLDEEGKQNDAALVRALLNIAPPNYLSAADHARKGLSGSVWFDFITSQFNPKHSEIDDSSLALSRALWRLGSNLFITTNYDRVLNWACPQESDVDNWRIESTAEQAASLRQRVERPTIWNLHGFIGDAAGLILTPDGYSRLYPSPDVESVKYKAALSTLRTVFASYTLLFVGYSLDDANLVQQLKEVTDLFEEATGPHYVLVKEGSEHRIQDARLPVQTITYRDHGEPLLELVRQLGDIASAPPPTSPNNGSTQVDSPTPTASETYDPGNTVFSVPFRAKGDQVVGRETALEAVRHQLTQGRRTAIGQTAAFQGLGGLGKTQLAVEYAYRYEDEYPNGIIWINADQDIDGQLTALSDEAKWLVPESEAKDKLDVARQQLRSRSNCLLIFDNLEDIKEIEDYLPEPSAEPHILVTSRREQPNFTPVPLELLSTELSLQLLIQEAGRQPEEGAQTKAAQEIADSLGELPLAIEIAGAYIGHRGLKWTAYRDLLNYNLKAALPSRFLSSFTQHEKDLYSTLRVDEELFAEEFCLRNIMDLLTLSGPSPMGVDLMCALLGVLSAAELTSALSLGTVLKLLQQSPDSQSYSIHRLVREVRREDVPLTTDIVGITCQKMGDWFESHRRKFADLPKFESGIEHLRAWQEYAKRFAPQHSSRLAWLQAYPPYHRGRYAESKQYIENAIALYKDASIDDAKLKVNLYNDLNNINLR